MFFCFFLFFFFFNDTATTEIYTLSLHDALPIYAGHIRVRTVSHGAAHVAYERHVYARIPGELGKKAHVLPLFDFWHIGEVDFVFNLHEDDWAALGDLVAANDRKNMVIPVLRCPQAVRVHAAHRETLRDDIGREAAAFELRIDVRAGPH